MKKRANLILKKKSYENLEKVFGYFRIFTFLFVFSIFVSIFTLFILKNKSNQEKQKLNTEKTILLESILARKEVEKNALLFNQRGITFNNFLKQDVNFLPYYKLLQKYLPLSSQAASIEKIDYDNKRNVTIVLRFNNYDNFYNSLSFLQDKEFLSIFDSLTLEAFSINEAKVNNYTLTLSGKFKQIN
ncbi:MAG TPA: hypothetical protein VK338_01580 [Candidatus Nitrosocosmicus sp.]|nr:hypothetical protein [Candidatus Nitrosocosmicus sp.]